jgi:hypothetical protein
LAKPDLPVGAGRFLAAALLLVYLWIVAQLFQLR